MDLVLVIFDGFSVFLMTCDLYPQYDIAEVGMSILLPKVSTVLNQSRIQRGSSSMRGVFLVSSNLFNQPIVCCTGDERASPHPRSTSLLSGAHAARHELLRTALARDRRLEASLERLAQPLPLAHLVRELGTSPKITSYLGGKSLLPRSRFCSKRRLV